MTESEWVRVSTAHQILSECVEIGKTTVYEWIEEGILDGRKIPGLGVRVRRESVLRVLKGIQGDGG